MIRFLSEILKKHMKLAKIIKISEIFNRLVFPLNFNRFCHPMTLVSLIKGHSLFTLDRHRLPILRASILSFLPDCHRFDQSALSIPLGNAYGYKNAMYLDYKANSSDDNFVQYRRSSSQQCAFINTARGAVLQCVPKIKT